MALLVTGAMGHVGYETVKQAAGLGLPVVAQYLSTFREPDAAAVEGPVTWVRCDLGDPFEVASLAGGHGIEGCIHTAAVPNDKVGLPQPLRTFQSNVAATAHLLECARRHGWRRFIGVSTGSIFQDWPDTTKPVPESEPPTPKSLYACTKGCAELMITAYAHSYGLSACSVRISWIYGPPLVPKVFDGPRGPIPAYLRRALRGERVDEPSGGDFAASFTFVPDCAQGLLTIYRAERLKHLAYNLGSGRNQTTLQVAEAIRAAVPGAEIDVGPGTAPWTDFTVMRGPLSCERMQQDFGFAPAHSLERGVAAFADWMRANPQSYAD